MKKYSAFAVAREALRDHLGWERAWRSSEPQKKYDVIIIGGAIMGSASAYFLSKNSDYNGKTLVIDKDLSFEFSSTARTIFRPDLFIF